MFPSRDQRGLRLGRWHDGGGGLDRNSHETRQVSCETQFFERTTCYYVGSSEFKRVAHQLGVSNLSAGISDTTVPRLIEVMPHCLGMIG